MTKDTTPQQEGRDYEDTFALRIGGKNVPMSGAGFTKLDVFGYKTIFSLKKTRNKSFRVDDDLFEEINHAIYAPGGVGMDYTGVLVVKTANHEIAALNIDDFMSILNRLQEAEERLVEANEQGSVSGGPSVRKGQRRSYLGNSPSPKANFGSRKMPSKRFK